MELSRLWVGMLTRNLGVAKTDDSITLSITVGGEQRLRHTFPDTTQRDQEAGQANLYEISVVGRNIVPEDLEPSSISISIGGRDAWQPEHIMVWGERPRSLLSAEREIIPLAIETDITTQLSTDSSEGPSSLPLRRVGTGDRTMPINRLFMLMTTGGGQIGGGLPFPLASAKDVTPGTDSSLEIQVVSEGHLAVLSEIRQTTQDDLESGGANFYSAPVIVPFTKESLDDRSITLRIIGVKTESTGVTGILDEWEPASFFLFGLDDAAGRPEFLVPLVHLPRWPYGLLIPDTTSGKASVTLPLPPERLAPGDAGITTALNSIGTGLNSIATGQERIIELLQKLVAK